MKNSYEVIVGNIGTTHQGNNLKEALKVFAEYKNQSIQNYGRASGEDVTLWINSEPTKEFFGTINQD